MANAKHQQRRRHRESNPRRYSAQPSCAKQPEREANLAAGRPRHATGPAPPVRRKSLPRTIGGAPQTPYGSSQDARSDRQTKCSPAARRPAELRGHCRLVRQRAGLMSRSCLRMSLCRCLLRTQWYDSRARCASWIESSFLASVSIVTEVLARADHFTLGCRILAS